jgi:hypothetical protein
MFEMDSGASWGQAHGATQQQFAAAQDQFLTRLRGALPSADAERAINEAFGMYLAVMQEPWASPEFSARAAGAYENYRRLTHTALAGDGGNEIIEAYRSYLQDLKRLWAEVESEALSPQDVTTIAQGMTWVAGIVLQASASRLAQGPS